MPDSTEDGAAPTPSTSDSDVPRSEGLSKGLLDGFDAYMTWSDDHYSAVLTSGLVVLDTNIMLEPYRYSRETRNDFFSILEKVKSRLWIPHQVAIEFWRRREGVARFHRERADMATKSIKEYSSKIAAAARRWVSEVEAPGDRINHLIANLEDVVKKLASEIDEKTDDEAVNAARHTTTDEVLGRLVDFFNGRVGPEISTEDYESAVAEAKRRCEQQIPPGFGDIDKDEDSFAGDYLIWEQILQEAERRKCDVLLVTKDYKPDWWRLVGKERRGPRPELLNELRRRAGTRLYMLGPRDFLEIAGRVFTLDVQSESLEDAQRERSDDQRLSHDIEQAEFFTGWTQHGISQLLTRLSTEGSVQAAVIRAAATRGGIAPRNLVYELGDYEPDRMLRGFTRPVRRITALLQRKGLVDDDAIEVLSPVYEDGMQATGFSVPTVLIPLILQA